MDIVKLSTEWARSEVFSAKIIALLSIVVLLTAVGFFYFGKTQMARAFIIPMLVSGVFLVAVSAGLYFANQPRIEKFEKEFIENPKDFVQKEIQRTEKSNNDFKLVFQILPLLAIVGSLLIFFLKNPHWKAIGIVLVLLSALLMLIDANTAARNDNYLNELKKSLNK